MRRTFSSQRVSRLSSVVLAIALSPVACQVTAAETTSTVPLAAVDPILKATGIERGLCVVVGADDPKQLCSLTNNGRVLVHGILLDEPAVEKMRRSIVEAGLYGLASVGKVSSFNPLPYNSNMVNVLVLDCDVLGPNAPPETEILRVIEPIHGAAWVKKNGQWAKRSKPMPKEMDEWTHFNHGPDNNPVSTDSVVGPMTGIQWTAHLEGGQNTSIGILLANGRWFNNYETFSLPRNAREPRLDARDAFNGMLLWRRRDPVKRSNHEASVVVDDQRIYGNLAADGVARALDAATGAEVAVYADAGKRFNFESHYKPVYPFYHSLADGVLVQASREKICGIAVASDKVVWSLAEAGQAKECQAMAISGGRVFLAFGAAGRPTFGYGHMHAKIGSIVCVDLKTGKELWRSAEFAGIRTANFVAYKNALVFEDFRGKEEWEAEGKLPPKGAGEIVRGLITLEASTGKLLKRTEFTLPLSAHLHGIFSVFEDLYEPMAYLPKISRWNIYTGTEGPFSVADRYNWCGFTRWTAKGILPHATCYIDRATNTIYGNFAARSPCDLGRFPGYGLVYSGTSYCACIPRLRGFTAQSCEPISWKPSDDNARLVRGAASAGKAPAQWPKPDEWPILLGNIKRSGFSASKLPASMQVAFQAKSTVYALSTLIGDEWRENESTAGPISAPTVADGKIFVAAIDNHRLDAFDAKSGELLWSFLAGGRIDSPPTIYGGLAILGCRDGWIYAVSTGNGALAWRFLAAPAERNIVVSAQVESLWPVFGSVMIIDGKLIVAAGRQCESDGGIFLYSLDPLTGTMLGKRTMDGNKSSAGPTSAPKRGVPVELDNDFKYTTDIMSSDGQLVYMTAVAIHPQTLHWAQHFRDGRYSKVGQINPLPPEVKGFDADYPGLHLSYPKYSIHSRHSGGDIDAKHGDGWTYGYTTTYGGPQAHRFVIRGNELFGLASPNGKALQKYLLDEKGFPINPENPVKDFWRAKPVLTADIGPQGMSWVSTFTCADGKLILAGERKAGSGAVQIRDLNYKLLQEVPLPAAPVENGVAIAYGRIHISLMDGSVAVLGEAQPGEAR